jgi:hypothetical protein
MDQELNIEKLFSKKFEHFEVTTSEEDWLKLNSKLKRNNFLKFSLVTFNVYYLLALITFAVTATFSGLNNHKLTKKVDQLEKTIKTYQKKEFILPPDSVKNGVIFMEPDQKKKIQNKTPLKAEPNPAKSATMKMLQPLNHMAINDSSLKINDNPIQIDTLYVRKTKVVKNIVVKKNSVVVKDTMVIIRELK